MPNNKRLYHGGFTLGGTYGLADPGINGVANWLVKRDGVWGDGPVRTAQHSYNHTDYSVLES